MTQKNKQYIVRGQMNGGAAYLTTRVIKSPHGKYRWSKKNKEVATVLSEGQARGAVRHYGGTMVQI